jgi:hypothetical protein
MLSMIARSPEEEERESRVRKRSTAGERTRALIRPSGGPGMSGEVGQACHNVRPERRVPPLPRQPDRWARPVINHVKRPNMAGQRLLLLST